MEEISWDDFEKLQIRVGTITKVEDYPEARKPSLKVWVDFGELGIKKTSAQIKDLYTEEELVGKQIIGVVNFPVKQIGSFMSEFLLTGFASDRGVVLAVPDSTVANGVKLY